MAQFGAPNFLSVIDAYEAGSNRRERSQLRELTERGRQLSGEVLAGNQNKLAELYSVNPEMGMQVQKFTDEQKAQRLDELASGAMAADTPEKWQAFVQRAAAQGHRLDPGETRESILDQAMGWKEKLAQQNSDRTFNAQQKNSDRAYQLDLQQFGLAQANANWQRKMDQAKLDAQSPDLVELYDPQTGQPFKAKYNPQTGGFDRVGGVKKDQGSGGEFGLNPVWAQDSNGNWQLFQPNKGGGAPARVNFPEGVNPQPQVNFLDTGTGYVPRATKGGQPVGAPIPKDVAGEAGQKETGKGMAERNLAQPQAKLTLSSTLSALDRLGNSARQIKEDPALGKITGWMSLVPNAPGGPAANVQAKLATLKSQVGFAVLQAMRDASKTGGALGNVSNFENEQLQNNLAALEQAQSVEQFQAALGQIVDYVSGAKGRLQTAYDQTYPTQQQAAPSDNIMSNDPQVGQVVNGYKIGATARNPQTGEAIVWDGNGWRPQ